MIPHLIAFFLKCLSLLPLSVSRSFGRCLGRVVWWVGGSPRRVTERNIGLAFPELSAEEQKSLARRSLESTGELAAEMGFVWNRPWETVRDSITEFVGVDELREAVAEGNGVIVFGPHLGNWEVGGLYLAEVGDALALYKPPQMQALDSMIRGARERSGTTLAATDGRGLATLVRTLRRGGITGVLPDQNPDTAESGENSVFMNVACFTQTLGTKLLHRSGARAFFGFAQRIPGGFRLQFYKAPEEIYSEDMAVSLKALNDGVERCLRLCPEQYQWEYKRFRTLPRSPVDYYAPDWRPENKD